ncbi:hypothetical protein D0C36_11670 [Mucilaginibacter conchicola]|uniref:Uncharacterized protein n=1 Tax=Mucilaginibacter conchicola TaxID=2303333 RepID=A0A372NU28_9SPHI|nr:hypothetical protein D0C36_11670 [Mucilaginibacter conchicola]
MKAISFVIAFFIQLLIIYAAYANKYFAVIFFLILFYGLFLRLYSKELKHFANAGWGILYGSISAVLGAVGLFVLFMSQWGVSC